jgi:predicted RNA-binding protein
MNEENLRYTIEHGIYGIPNKRAEKLVQQVRVGDRIVVYVMKEDCKDLCESFAAVLEVVSDWRRSSKPTWPDEAKDSKVEYPWVVDVRVLASGKVPIDEVYSELSKILPLEKSQSKLSKSKRVIGFGTKLRIFGMNFSKKPVSNELCELIMRRLRAGSKVAFEHETVKDWLVDIGEVLGYYVKTEFESGGYRFDVVWWDSERDFKGERHPAAVFEVQRGGSLVEALARLKHALDRWNIYGLYLVVTEEEDVERARRLVEPHLKGSFHELQGRLRIWTAKRVREIRDALTKYRDEVRELSTLRD